MSLLEKLHKSNPDRAPIGALYGRPGTGKTTLGAQLPNPIFIQTEDGLTAPSLAGTETFGVLDSYDKVLEAFALIAEHHKDKGWETVVIDGIDRLQPLITDYVCRKNKWARLEDGAYGKGQAAMKDEWRDFMSCLMALRNKFNLAILLIGHHKEARKTPPDAEPYMQYTMTLHDDVNRIIVADADFVFFATYPVHTVSSDGGFGKKSVRAVTEKPVLMTQETGAYVAKNRYNFPAKISLDVASVMSNIPHWAAKLPK